MGGDDLGDKLGRLKGKAEDLVDQHEDAILKGIDQLANLVDDRTKGKNSKKIDDAADKAKDLIAKLADKGEKAKSKPKSAAKRAARKATPPKGTQRA